MQPTSTSETAALQSAIPIAWAARLIERMQALYGAKFAQQWDSIAPARLAEIWAEELAGLSGDEIATGLAACKTRPWPPTLPEFIGLCRPWMDAETAFREAVAGMAERNGGGMGKWSHPAVYWAAVRIGAHDLLSTGWQAMRTRWEAALRDVMAQGRWHPIPAPALQLTAPGGATTSRAQAQGFLDQIKRDTGMSAMPASGVEDTKAWARRILANMAGRTATVVDMAKRALEAKA